MNEVLSKDQLEALWQNIQKTHTQSAIVNLIRTFLLQNNIKVLKDTLPSIQPYYISRTLSNRIYIKFALLPKDCKDKFVIDGISRPELSKIAFPELTACSSTQVIQPNRQFISLEDSNDWEKIRKSAISTVHLIKYEPETKAFLLQETVGSSSFLTKNLEKQIINEDQFICEVYNTKKKRALICDGPGTGKTFLLTSLARRVNQEVNKIGVYVELKKIVKISSPFLKNELDQSKNVMFYNYIAESNLTAQLLATFIKLGKIKMDIFSMDLMRSRQNSKVGRKNFFFPSILNQI